MGGATGAKKVGVWKLAILFAGCFAFLERGKMGLQVLVDGLGWSHLNSWVWR
jgi:hypothetical protein